MHPLVNRTSPKGMSFVGTCAACGKRGLTFKDLKEDCPNQRAMTFEAALVEGVAYGGVVIVGKDNE